MPSHADEVRDLLTGLPRDAFGRLRGERLRQLEFIGSSMALDDKDFAFVKAEIVNLRTAALARLEKWRRISGGH